MLTLKKFKELTKNMPDDSVICVPCEHNMSSINFLVNFVKLTPVEHSHGNSNTIIIGLDSERNGVEENKLIVKKLVDKNTWKMVE